MNKKLKKRIVISATVVFLIVFLFPVWFVWVLGDVRYTKTVKTKFGDKFKVTYDERKAESMVESTNSDMYIYVGDKIDKDDFVILYNTESLRVYSVESFVIFDYGDGFELFSDKNADDRSEVAEIVKDRLLSDHGFFKENIKNLLKSEKYHDEAQKVIQYIEHDDYDKLSAYGLSNDIKNDGYTLKYIKIEINQQRYNTISNKIIGSD